MANAHNIRSVSSQQNDEVNLEIDDTAALRTLEEEAHNPPLLVLSRDAELVETVRKAAPRGTPVTHSPDLDHIADRLPSLKPGVLLVDTASTADVAAMVAQLTQHFPELVVVVAGKREDSAALMQLTAAGRIFRFLLTPLSHGQTRLALEAAIAQHADLKASGQRLVAGSSSGGESKNYVVTYGALAAGLLLVVGGIWFGVTKLTGESSAPPVAQSTAPGAQSTLPERPDPVQAELAFAKEAFDQGRLLEPAGESALDFYRSALALDPNSEAAKAGIRAVADKILERAEAALTAERLEEAIRNIETARDIDASHPRLAFLDTQIARERERLKLTQAQEVVRRVNQLLVQANERMASGRLIGPGANARDALLEARRLDPTDPGVAQAIRELSNQLAEAARQSLAAGNTDEAQSYVAAARSLGSAGASLTQIERAIADASRSASATATARRAPQPPAAAPAASSAGPNVDSLIADIRQRISDGKLIDPAGSSARDGIASLQAQAPNHPAVEELSRALTARLLEVGKQAMNAKAYDRSAQLIAAARSVGARYSESAIAQAERELDAARAASNIVSASSLKRVKMTPPQYPESARKRGIEGWVEVMFTVTPSGTVEDVEVRNSSPADVFDDAAVRAVRQWRFEPVERNGEKVPQRAVVRLKFAKDG